jgi:hypothetical protein
MAIQEVRSSTKWNAIRSKAVPSNVMHPAIMHPVPDSSLTMNAGASQAERMDKPENFDKSGKAIKNKAALPAKLHKSPAFTGSTGSRV